MRRLPLPIVLLALLALACAPTEEAGTPAEEASPTATATPTVAPAATVAPPDGVQAVFIEGDVETFPPSGVLWISDLDGANRRRLTSEGESAAFSGALPSQSGGLLLYYTTEDDETARKVWRLDVDSGERENLLRFDGPDFRAGGAVISPDGRYLAYAELDGLSLLDLTNGKTKRLLGGTACKDNPSVRCVYYMLPQWSADGRLIAVERGFPEGGSQTVVDPFSDPPRELMEARTGEGPMWGAWAAAGQSLCGYGLYGPQGGGVFVAQPPNWSWRELLPEYEWHAVELPPIERSVADCGWLADGRIVFTAVEVNNLTPYPSSPPERHQLFVIPRDQGTARPMAELPGRAEGANRALSPQLLTDAGGDIVIVQETFYASSSGSRATQPRLVDTATGTLTPILKDGDWVVAVLAP